MIVSNHEHMRVDIWAVWVSTLGTMGHEDHVLFLFPSVCGSGCYVITVQ